MELEVWYAPMTCRL